ncbi:MAG TPA: sodium-translocating pyrophosphatase [Actinomycetota bacterium]|jgi:K(+)-stimulated pyrophosphate-energized sodium pump|nr:sodium-translocating pyrophosphatase [Actinomycetota bacterium]
MPGPLYLAVEGGSIDVQLDSFEQMSLYIILGISVLALLVAGYFAKQVLAAPRGTEKMIEISDAIQEGSRAYLKRQFSTLSIFVVILTLGLFFLPVGEVSGNAGTVKIARSIAFLLGAGFSASIGFVGMTLAVKANVRVANAAQESQKRALTIAFRAGGVCGMFTVGLGLLGAAAIFLIFKGDAPTVLVGFGFGGALLAMFMRVGGGIFTKAADVGADLVGKVEQGIPEDDPRNAATIADNVGDNVGDCAGMAADIFESYEVTLVAALILGFTAYSTFGARGAAIGVMFPLFVRAIGVITSIIGIYLVNPRSESESGIKSINRGFFYSGILSALLVFLLTYLYFKPNGEVDWAPAWAVTLGLVLAAVIHYLTEYYTSTEKKPVKEIAAATQTGPATTIISGFAFGLESTVWSIVAIAGAIGGAFLLGGGDEAKALYMIALTGMGMLTTVGVIVSMDTFGPIADNAHGVAEMSGGLGGKADEIMASLDAVGNTTKAITKGMAIATAVIAATSLFGSFRDSVIDVGGEMFRDFAVRIDRPEVLIGLLIGGAVPFLFSSLTISAVGRTAFAVVQEVRRQFREHPGIMDYTEKPNYARVVDIVTKASLQELATPGLLAVLTPILVGFALGAEALGAFLAGVILCGQLLAVMLSNSGGAWDNAKKLVEEGAYGGKGSSSHEAAVIGDTVGDPFKDTAGPALNPLIKVMNLVAVLVAVPVVTIINVEPDPTVRYAVVLISAAILAWTLRASSRRQVEGMNTAGAEASDLA